MNQRRRSAQPSSVWKPLGTSKENCPPWRTSERSRSMKSLNRFQSPVPWRCKGPAEEFLVALVILLVLAPAGGELRVRFQFLGKPLVEARAVHAHFAELRFAAIEAGGEFFADGLEPLPRRVADDAVKAGGAIGRARHSVRAGRGSTSRRRAGDCPPHWRAALPSALNQQGQK